MTTITDSSFRFPTISKLDRDTQATHVKEFIEEIDVSNQKHGPNTPFALILLQEAFDEVLTNYSFLFSIATIARVERVAFRVLRDAPHFGKIIKETAVQITPPFHLVFNCHGDSKTLFYKNAGKISASGLIKEDFENLHENASIFLLSCLGGQSLAEKMSLIACRKVFATSQEYSPLHSYLHFCPDDHSLQLVVTINNTQNAKMFEGHKVSIPCTNSRVFEHRFKALKTRQDKGNAQLSFDLALHYKEGIGTTQNKVKYLEHLEIAAQKGHVEGNFYLGAHFFDEQSYKKALFYLEIAAKQEHLEGQYWTGVCYLEGKGTLLNYDQAVTYLGLAANRGHTLANNRYPEALEKKDKQEQDLLAQGGWIEIEDDPNGLLSLAALDK